MKTFVRAAAIGIAFAVPQGLHAAIISYQAVNTSASNWRYEYTVTNDGSVTSEVLLFSIAFDPALYDENSLASASAPAITQAWDEIFLPSGLGVPAFYDVLAKNTGITTGNSVSNFVVTFTWLGQGTPGSQAFEIYDPDTFNLLGTGTTTVVPLPGALALFLPGMAVLAATARRRRRA